MYLRMEELNSTNIGLWEDFNQKMDEGTFFHTIKWKRILESLGNNSHYYIILDGDEPVAICPFFELNISGFKGITTLPDSDYNHLIVKDNNPRIIEFIRKELESRAKKRSWSFIIFNSLDKNIGDKLNASFYPNFSMGTMVLDLEELNPDKIWNEIFNAKRGQRRYIKRFEKNGFQIKELDSKKDIKALYNYYEENINYKKGTLYPYSHFKDLYEIYSSKNIYSGLIIKEDFIAGGFLNFIDEQNKVMHSRYIAINRDVPNTYHIQYPLLWEQIQKADEIGLKKVDFGSNINDQSHPGYKLKRNFGAKYQHSYSVLRPVSRLFKLGHNVYRSINPVKTK